MIKLVVSDIDGTLIKRDQTISDENRKVIEELKNRAIPVVLCTGRIHSTAVPYALDLGLEQPVISCNGAMIRHATTYETIYIQYMEEDNLKKAIDILKRYKQQIHGYDDQTIYVEEEGFVFKFAQEFLDNQEDHNHPNALKVEKVENIKENIENSLKLLKIGYFTSCKGEDEVEREILKIPGLTIVRSNESFKDVMREEITKGSAVKILAEHMGIDMSEVFTIGDNDNDIEMLKLAGIGVAMGNANDRVKVAANDVAPHNEDDGFAWAIRKYVL